MELPPLNPATAFIAVLDYFVFSYALQTCAAKLERSGPWLAWFPILNIYLLIKTAGAPWWHFLLVLCFGTVAVFFPPVSTVLWIYFGFMMWSLAQHRHQHGFVGIASLIPGIGPFVFAYIAFHDGVDYTPSLVGYFFTTGLATCLFSAQALISILT